MFDGSGWRQIVSQLPVVAVTLDSTESQPVFTINANTGESRTYNPSLDNDVSYSTGVPNNGGASFQVQSMSPAVVKFNILLSVVAVLFYLFN